MKSNANCKGAQHVTVYLNGVEVDDCIEADEEEGVAWVVVRDSEGCIVGEKYAPPLTYTDGLAMVYPLRGKVEIRITPPPGVTEEAVRAQLTENFTSEIQVKGR